jgi:hypothetical protein
MMVLNKDTLVHFKKLRHEEIHKFPKFSSPNLFISLAFLIDLNDSWLYIRFKPIKK